MTYIWTPTDHRTIALGPLRWGPDFSLCHHIKGERPSRTSTAATGSTLTDPVMHCTAQPQHVTKFSPDHGQTNSQPSHSCCIHSQCKTFSFIIIIIIIIIIGSTAQRGPWPSSEASASWSNRLLLLQIFRNPFLTKCPKTQPKVTDSYRALNLCHTNSQRKHLGNTCFPLEWYELSVTHSFHELCANNAQKYIITQLNY
jgi:hypothetical protein